jgi:hypothetical protein
MSLEQALLFLTALMSFGMLLLKIVEVCRSNGSSKR